MTDKPSINCPAELRKRFADEIALIRRTTRTAAIRAQAIDHAIKKFKDANPQYFRQEQDNDQAKGREHSERPA